MLHLLNFWRWKNLTGLSVCVVGIFVRMHNGYLRMHAHWVSLYFRELGIFVNMLIGYLHTCTCTLGILVRMHAGHSLYHCYTNLGGLTRILSNSIFHAVKIIISVLLEKVYDTGYYLCKRVRCFLCYFFSTISNASYSWNWRRVEIRSGIWSQVVCYLSCY